MTFNPLITKQLMPPMTVAMAVRCMRVPTYFTTTTTTTATATVSVCCRIVLLCCRTSASKHITTT